jgi:hypothetical protein
VVDADRRAELAAAGQPDAEHDVVPVAQHVPHLEHAVHRLRLVQREQPAWQRVGPGADLPADPVAQQLVASSPAIAASSAEVSMGTSKKVCTTSSRGGREGSLGGEWSAGRSSNAASALATPGRGSGSSAASVAATSSISLGSCWRRPEGIERDLWCEPPDFAHPASGRADF